MLSTVTVVPSHEFTFVEAQGIDNWMGYHSFGWGVSRQPRAEGGWVMDATLFVEWDKGKPFVLALMTWFLSDDGRYLPEGELPSPYTRMSFPVDPDRPGIVENLCESLFMRYGIAMATLAMTFGLMHSKNVDVVVQVPAEKLSRAHQRRRGVPLTRYSVLDIHPVTKALERDGKVGTDGLGAALHICRGHFKTYRPEAPLFGKLSGQYWWNEHQRGKAEHGEVHSSYRVHPAADDARVGRVYEPVDEHTELAATTREGGGRDPDLSGRGLRAHNRVQNQLAEALLAADLTPLRPAPDESQYDLGWFLGAGDLYVTEVKSLTDANEVQQVRLAIGQVLHYATALAAPGRRVHPVIACERQPTDGDLVRACRDHGIAIVWPECFADWLKKQKHDEGMSGGVSA
ncbi:hypothetical protein [Planomonospora parontospora]|uniref:hypothetical protein n=1 Tax=Planomonospora parontospora TaxID=58119 RepID=UPI00166F7796|nr:hypothetical protein [Planomonospora parontospora]GGL51540.1 hypothetical protein GCM10014719_61050 [Planomonospora parontospora subsp. antibiotica]GII20213.1 hypothetical protein Ppa05_69390 [Planomonospora parontospora subsp. antibiotica]